MSMTISKKVPVTHQKSSYIPVMIFRKKRREGLENALFSKYLYYYDYFLVSMVPQTIAETFVTF